MSPSTTPILRVFVVFAIAAAFVKSASLRREKGAMSKDELEDIVKTMPYAKKTTQRIQILAPYLPSSVSATTQRREVIDAPTVGTPPLIVRKLPSNHRVRHPRRRSD
ncbi:hypothetical protein L596_018256 [Steinernema carpocapsae]|nr:hypothetical protein L596_018256 [Steinernema carpocapsae]